MKNFVFIIVCITGFFCIFESLPAFCENFPVRVKRPVDDSISIRRKTQQTEDKWAGERARLKIEYEKLEEETERLTAQNMEMGARRRSVDLLDLPLGEVVVK